MSRCRNCYRPIATSKDWEMIPEGEGDHLCWDQYDCRREPIPIRDDLYEIIMHWFISDTSDEEAIKIQRVAFHESTTELTNKILDFLEIK